MNKKGMLLAEETLKIIIAVIAISFLIYLLVNVYLTGANNQKYKQAEALSQRMSEIFNSNLSEEEINQISPSGWKIFAFVGSERKPDSCAGENCLCVCDDLWIERFDRQINECSNGGVCIFEENLDNFGDILISTDTSIKIIKSDQGISIRRIW